MRLTPTVDHLFEEGFISFEDCGQPIASPVADPKSLMRTGLDPEGRVKVLRVARGVAAR